ncbi:hypothetical protein DFP72DRAFT_745137, partial [Ephemerocybe angulata]
VFTTAYDIFQKNTDLIGDAEADNEGSRRLLLKITNSLTSKLEIGSPLACLYLLGNPDHYKSHNYVPFWWRRYVNKVQAYWAAAADKENGNGLNKASLDGDAHLVDERVIIDIRKSDGTVSARTILDDYLYRPPAYEAVCLYDWVRYYTKRTTPKRKAKKPKIDIDPEEVEEAEESNSEFSTTPTGKQSSYMKFSPEHPQFETHEVRCNFKKDAPLPTWLGGTVPRSDQGDREYYCMTM